MLYNNVDISFVFENTLIEVSKIADETMSEPYPEHSHGKDCYELHYIASGDGYATINKTSYELHPGTLFITGPNVLHSQFPGSDNMCEYGIYLKLVQKKPNIASELTTELENHPCWIGNAPAQFSAIFESILTELKCKRLGYIQSATALLKYLLISIIRQFSISLENSETNGTKWDAKIQLLMDDAFLKENQTITLSVLAKRLDLSERQTQRIIQREYGKTFQQKKTEARMSHAKLLLADKNLSIAQISEQLGYTSSEHFSYAFKKAFNETAKSYRERIN